MIVIKVVTVATFVCLMILLMIVIELFDVVNKMEGIIRGLAERIYKRG